MNSKSSFRYSQEPTNRPYSYPAAYGSEGTCRNYVTLSTAELLDLATMLVSQNRTLSRGNWAVYCLRQKKNPPTRINSLSL